MATRYDGDGTFVVSLPKGLSDGWCRISFTVQAAAKDQRTDTDTVACHRPVFWRARRDRAALRQACPDGLLVQIDALAEDAAINNGLPLAMLWAAPCRGYLRTVTFLPYGTSAVRLRLFAPGLAVPPILVRLRGLSRLLAACAIARRHAPDLAMTLLRGLLFCPRDLPRRLRAELGHRATQTSPPPYMLWAGLFDAWTDADLAQRHQARGKTGRPDIAVFVLHAMPGGAALAASLAAAASQCGPGCSAPVPVGPGSATLAMALAGTTATFVAVLQAGEVMAPRALELLANLAAGPNETAIVYADEDRINVDGTRHTPLFKQPPSRTLMLSGALCTGVWLIRRDHLAAYAAGADAWAETLRLDAWLRLQESGGAASSHRLPLVLTHRRPDTEAAPPAMLAAVARAHIARTGLPASITAGRPLQLRLAAPRAAQPRVSIVIPSTCHAPHVLDYIGAILACTDYSDFEAIIVVAGPLPLNASQERVLTQLESDPRVRRVLIETDRFNYAVANNRAVATADSPLVCLLNDDVAPRAPGWLAAMVGHLADPAIGVVGARLCYPDHSIQHAGVVLLADGTGEHICRFLSCGAPGYAGRARLSQEVSAVTGACLLTRRELWDRLGGLDESYASAFNDVDFCLRVRETGLGVVIAADATLTHAESISFNRHYGPDERVRNTADRARVRGRFPADFGADPFQHPHLAVRCMNAWSPAIPALPAPD